MEVKSNMTREFNKYAILEEGHGAKICPPVIIQKPSKLKYCHDIIKIAFYLEIMTVIAFVGFFMLAEYHNAQERMKYYDSISDYDESNATSSDEGPTSIAPDNSETTTITPNLQELTDDEKIAEQLTLETLIKTYKQRIAELDIAESIIATPKWDDTAQALFNRDYSDDYHQESSYDDTSAQDETKK